MKFMRIGSKPDTFKMKGDNARFVANELVSDIIVNVDGAKFYLHKFPLLPKCASLQKLLASNYDNKRDEVDLSNMPGGPSAFEICAKFCYGMTVILNAYNVVSARCAAEYLGMHETTEKGNLIYKIDIFLGLGIFRSWKDSIIVLQTTKSFLPLSDELQLAGLCIDAIATKACTDVSHVDWSYTYNRKKLTEETANVPNENGVTRNRNVPRDWRVEDLCDLEIGVFKRVLTKIKSEGLISGEVFGEALKAYAYRNLSGFKNGVALENGDLAKYKPILETLVWLLPAEKSSVSCSFLLRLLKAAIFVGSGEMASEQLVKRIGQQLQEASVSDLLIRSQEGEETLYDVGIVQSMVREFIVQDETGEFEVQEMRKPRTKSEASRLMVAKLVDGYLAEIAKDPKLPASRFADLAEMVSGVSRPSHDGLYRAIDRYLKEHPEISKSEKKRICKLMDCRMLSADACTHAVQNERLPLRVVVQVLFFEQVRASAAASSGSCTPDVGNRGSHGSSRSVPPNMDEEWDAVATAEELKALKGEIAALRLNGGGEDASGRKSIDRAAAMSKGRGLIKSRKIFGKLLSFGRGRSGGEHSGGSDSSESLGSVNHPEEVISSPMANRRASVDQQVRVCLSN